MTQSTLDNPLQNLDIPLERDVFLRTLIRELAGTLQDIVGLEEASGFISVVGQNMGKQIDQSYKTALKVDQLSREQVGQVLVDLKARIQGDFYIIYQIITELHQGCITCDSKPGQGTIFRIAIPIRQGPPIPFETCHYSVA